MNFTTLTKIATADLTKEIGSEFAKSLATTAGVFGGLALVAHGKTKVRSILETRAARKSTTDQS